MDIRIARNTRRNATDEETRTLRHVIDSIPFVTWIALLASAAERFTFYAVSTPWQNYIQNSLESKAAPGALGLGQETATTITSAFYFFTMVAPVPFAIVSDTWLGRYKTLCFSFLLNICGCLVLFITSLSTIINDLAKLIGLVLSMFLLGLGTGGVKATMSPFIGDQYPVMEPQMITLSTGEDVIVDRELTLQYIYNVFFWLTNIASFSLVASTFLERIYGFWAAYLLPLCSVWFLVPLMLIWRESFVKLPPRGNVLPQAGKIILYSIQERFSLDAAKPSVQRQKHGRNVPWDDTFVSEMKRGLKACQVMACFVPFHLCMNQMSNNLVSQAGQMQLGGIPNDTVQVLNSMACVLLGPIVQRILYPTLQKLDVRFGPIARMATAFIFMSLSMATTAGVQKVIYSRGPCYEMPLACPAAEGGSIPNNVSVWVQAPIYFILAFAEILGFATLSEFAFSQAPETMRSVVQALGQLSAGVGSGLGIALSPVATDPSVLYLYTGLAITMAISASIFIFTFRNYEEHKVQVEEQLSLQPSPGEVIAARSVSQTKS